MGHRQQFMKFGSQEYNFRRAQTEPIWRRRTVYNVKSRMAILYKIIQRYKR